VTDLQPGWWPDPTQRHEYRYWDGQAWSDVVADGGVESREPGRSGSRVVLLGVLLVVVAVVGVVIGALAGGDDEPSASSDEAGTDRQELVDGLAAGLYENFGGTFSHDEADCAADSLMSKVGQGRLLDLGLGPSNPYDVFSVTELTPEEQHDVVSSVVGCISDDRLVGYLASTYSEGGELTYEQGECIAEGQIELLGPDRLRELVVEGNFSPGASMASLADPEDQDDMEAIDRECTEGT
jgi:hypothetical protein